MRILFASSEVGLGHITRDIHLAQHMPWANVSWITSGLALRYLEEKNVDIHPVSYMRQDLNRYFEKLFENGVFKARYSALKSLAKAGRLNANTLLENVDLLDYDLLIADEFWDLVVCENIHCKSVFITDFIKFKSVSSLIQKLILPFVNRSLSKGLEKFDIRLYVGLDPNVKMNGFEHYGQLFTHGSIGVEGVGGGAVISIGGTSVGSLLVDKAAEALKSLQIEYSVLGPPPYYKSDPLLYIASSDLVITLGGYSTLIEVARFKKRAIITPLGMDFEQYDNARLFEGRSGYRVVPLHQLDEKMLSGYVKEVLDETPDPPRFMDGSEFIAARIKELVKG